ncbi:hypothetical protein ZEAMMB73_Zm00001d033305 [Zea mays]|uniref:Uncharacterized protein n=1 Tax=Zea mays TaxID=4577 RepID=A0A1D6KXL7_MAIZE|nr:hypothetical protein ZEAMMB73_Zm00001d033305 [Zea mays]
MNPTSAMPSAPFRSQISASPGLPGVLPSSRADALRRRRTGSGRSRLLRRTGLARGCGGQRDAQPAANMPLTKHLRVAIIDSNPALKSRSYLGKNSIPDSRLYFNFQRYLDLSLSLYVQVSYRLQGVGTSTLLYRLQQPPTDFFLCSASGRYTVYGLIVTQYGDLEDPISLLRNRESKQTISYSKHIYQLTTSDQSLDTVLRFSALPPVPIVNYFRVFIVNSKLLTDTSCFTVYHICRRIADLLMCLALRLLLQPSWVRQIPINKKNKKDSY